MQDISWNVCFLEICNVNDDLLWILSYDRPTGVFDLVLCSVVCEESQSFPKIPRIPRNSDKCQWGYTDWFIVSFKAVKNRVSEESDRVLEF